MFLSLFSLLPSDAAAMEKDQCREASLCGHSCSRRASNPLQNVMLGRDEGTMETCGAFIQQVMSQAFSKPAEAAQAMMRLLAQSQNQVDSIKCLKMALDYADQNVVPGDCMQKKTERYIHLAASMRSAVVLPTLWMVVRLSCFLPEIFLIHSLQTSPAWACAMGTRCA